MSKLLTTLLLLLLTPKETHIRNIFRGNHSSLECLFVCFLKFLKQILGNHHSRNWQFQLICSAPSNFQPEKKLCWKLNSNFFYVLDSVSQPLHGGGAMLMREIYGRSGIPCWRAIQAFKPTFWKFQTNVLQLFWNKLQYVFHAFFSKVVDPLYNMDHSE